MPKWFHDFHKVFLKGPKDGLFLRNTFSGEENFIEVENMQDQEETHFLMGGQIKLRKWEQLES